MKVLAASRDTSATKIIARLATEFLKKEAA